MKTISLFLAFIFIILLCPLIASAEEVCIENGSFETDFNFWTNAEISGIYPFDGKNCLSVLSSSAEVQDSHSFIAGYEKTVLLTRNNAYEISFYIRTDSISEAFAPSCTPHVSTENKRIRLDVSNPSYDWQKVSATFLVDKTDYYTFSVETLFDIGNATFFIDEMTLSVLDFVPTEISITGPRTASIPDIGIATYQFSPCVINKENSCLPIHNGMITVESALPEGVIFSEESGILSVSSDTEPGASVLFKCYIPDAITISSSIISVSLTKSVVENGNFENLPIGSGWNTEEFDLIKDSDGFFAKVPTKVVSENSHIGSLTSARSMVLYAKNLYVFRASVRTDYAYTARNMAIQSVGPDSDNLIRFQLANISGNQWNELAVAFRVQNDGIYNIALDLHSPFSSYVYVNNISVQPESKEPLSIYFDSPFHITRPNDGNLTVPLTPLVVNQFLLPQNDAVSFAVEPETPHVTVSSGSLTISPLAECKEYTIIAYLAENVNTQARRTFLVSEQSVYDGSFENTEPGQTWMTAEPSVLNYVTTYKDIYPSHGHRLARLTMNGSVSMVMSDSVYAYTAGKSYIFEADMSMLAPDIETVVTILVDNSYSDSFDDNLVVGQFSLSKTEKRICHLFTPSESVMGRIMIAFNTPNEHDQQIVFMDDVSVSVASVYASSVVISGSPFIDKNIIGNYRFSSNFNALDASTYRWLISDTPSGIFTPIPGERDSVLSITQDMINKYVKFEVTPVSPNGPVIGESVSSAMILIGEPISHGATPEVPTTVLSPTVLPEQPADETVSSKSELHAMDITPFLMAGQSVLFYDLQNHWAAEEIAILTESNIVQGRGNGLFEPEAQITRAEFSAILARAFQLAPIFYENTFSDVRSSDWYAGVVAVITKYGITQGTTSYTFSPNLPITREEMAVMIMRSYRKTGSSIPNNSVRYEDSSLFSSWSATDIAAASALGLMNGMPGDRFMPKSNATRAEAAVVIYRMLSKFFKK